VKLGILGTGHIGSTLARGFVAAGHEVTLGSRDPDSSDAVSLLQQFDGKVRVVTVGQAAEDADVVVLAVPWAAAGETIHMAGDLSGKILIDCTNPIGPNLRAALPNDTSGAEQVEERAHGARVVKAFSTAGFNIFADPRFDGQVADLHLCGDDAEAKAAVADLARDLGLEPVDCGPLSRAELLESLARLWIALARDGAGRDIAFKLLRRP
jgi:hypothetical protein